MKKIFFNIMSIFPALLLLISMPSSSSSPVSAAEGDERETVYRPQLWNPDDPVGISVQNPNNEPLALPEPYYPKTFEEIYGPGITEDNLLERVRPSNQFFPKIIRVGGNVTFQITYIDGPNEGFNDPTLGTDRRNALAFAVNIWAERIQGPASISIEAEMSPKGGTPTGCNLASAGPGAFYSSFTNQPIANTYYPEPLVEILSGSDPDTNVFDFSIDYNSDVDSPTICSGDWYYGTDGLPTGNDIDFVTVTIHEMTHGLGFSDSFNASGQFGLGSPKDGIPTIYDRFVVNSAGTPIISIPISSTNVTSPVFWNGIFGKFAYNHDFLDSGTNNNIPLYAPVLFDGGSSIAHLDESTFTGDWELMTPFNDGVVHTPDVIVMGILQDIGHSLPFSRYVDDNAIGFEDGSSGNPFNTLSEGVNNAPVNGFVRILPGTYLENLTITKALTLIAPAGGASIGD